MSSIVFSAIIIELIEIMQHYFYTSLGKLVSWLIRFARIGWGFEYSRHPT